MPQQGLWLSPAHPSGIFGPNSCPAVSPWCHLRSLVSVAVQENCPALCSVVLLGTSKLKKGSDNKKCSVLITCFGQRGWLGCNTALAVTSSALFAASQQPAAVPGDRLHGVPVVSPPESQKDALALRFSCCSVTNPL